MRNLRCGIASIGIILFAICVLVPGIIDGAHHNNNAPLEHDFRSKLEQVLLGDGNAREDDKKDLAKNEDDSRRFADDLGDILLAAEERVAAARNNNNESDGARGVPDATIPEGPFAGVGVPELEHPTPKQLAELETDLVLYVDNLDPNDRAKAEAAVDAAMHRAGNFQDYMNMDAISAGTDPNPFGKNNVAASLVLVSASVALTYWLNY